MPADERDDREDGAVDGARDQQPAQARAGREFALAWLASAGFFVVYCVLAIVTYRSFHSGIDLGIFTQALSSGRPELPDLIEGGSHYAFHFSPDLELGVLALRLSHSPLALQLLQAAASALAGPAVFLIAARRLPLRVALVLTGVALTYPPLAAVTFVDFHENGFVAPLVLWLAWAVLARRFGLAAALAVLLLGVKEDEAFVLAWAAGVTGLRARRRGDARLAALSLGAVVVALAVPATYFAVLQPHLAAGRSWDPLRFYRGGAGDGASVPYTSPQRLGYLLEALYPLLFAPLCSPALIYVVPGMTEDLLSRRSLPFSMDSHYPAVWIPWMLLAAIDGAARLRGRWRPYPAAMLTACVAVLAFASPTHWRRAIHLPDAHDALLQRRLDALPPNAGVATQDEIFAHLGFDPNARSGLGTALPEFVVIDRTRAGDSFFERPLVAFVRRAGRRYALIDASDGVEIYRRVPGPSTGVR